MWDSVQLLSFNEALLLLQLELNVKNCLVKCENVLLGQSHSHH